MSRRVPTVALAAAAVAALALAAPARAQRYVAGPDSPLEAELGQLRIVPQN